MAKVLPHNTTRKRIWIPWQFAVLATSTPSQLKTGTLHFLKKSCVPASLITVFLQSQADLKVYEASLPKSSYGHLCVGQEAGLLTAVMSYYKEGTPLVICRDSIQKVIQYSRCAPQKQEPVKHLFQLVEGCFQACQKEKCMLWGLYPVANGLYFQPTVSNTLKLISGGLWGCFNPGPVVGPFQHSVLPETEMVLKLWTLFKGMLRWNGVGVVWSEPSPASKLAESLALAKLFPAIVRVRTQKDYVNLEVIPPVEKP